MEQPKTNNLNTQLPPVLPNNQPAQPVEPVRHPGIVQPANVKSAKRLHDYKFIFAFVLLLAAAGAGGGSYYMQQKKIKNLNYQISQLNTQIVGLNKEIENLKSAQAGPVITPISNGSTKTYSYNNVYTLSYPSTWTVGSKPAQTLGSGSLLDSSVVTFTPPGLPSGASPIDVSSYNSGDLNTVFKQNAYPSNVTYAPQTQTINGYSTVYYQNVVAKPTSAATGIGYTDDYYGLTNGTVTLLFQFRESQSGNSSQTYNAQSFVSAYEIFVKSVKFS